MRKREYRQDSHGLPREFKCELLTLPELEIAELEIIKFKQKIAFAEEIEALKKGNPSRSQVCLLS